MNKLLAATLLFALTHSAFAGDAPKHRFIYNSDGGNMFIYKEPPMSPEDVYSYVDEVVGTSVTSFFVSPNYGQPLLFPSEVTGMIGYNATEEQEEKIQEIGPEKESSMERAILNLRGLVSQGQDPFGVILDRAKDQKLETFISFRLNEIHNVQEPESLLLTDFWREHPDWRVGEEGDEVGELYQEIIGPRVHPIVASWFWGALNFAIPEVREYALAQLQECAERYPQADGIEIDFQRFPIYFKQGEEKEHIGTMTDWLREVRKMIDKVSKERDRPLLLSARILAKPEQNLGIGLDPETWAKEGLLDFMVVSHYLRNDYTLPIDEFRKIVPEGYPLYASIEVEPTREKFLEIARPLWEKHPDGIYLFNFFTSREGGREPPFDLLNQLGYAETLPSATE
ncbi:MAG: hypothetical protein KC940_25170 [Candidatus Omnitrophica bacterium]|nr:hypothetical protein [Candidatus Omnitrophota bacterium]